MTVVSLLNSGADVQTDDEVYTFFSFTYLHLYTCDLFTLEFSYLSVPYCGV